MKSSIKVLKEMLQRSPFTVVCPSAPQVDATSNKVVLTEEEVRQACYAYANENCSYGTRFIRNAILTDLQNDCAYHYKLETLGEKREITYKKSIYKEGTTIIPESIDIDDPWEFPVSPDFAELHLTKPGTVFVRDCESCLGKKLRRCFYCWGSGYEPCSSCKGTGNESSYALCGGCDGTGKRWCLKCGLGRGTFECKTCKGNGKMKYEKQLIISRKIHAEDFVSNSSNLPSDLIPDAIGQELFSESASRVDPVHLSLNSEVNEASTALIAKHRQSFTDERIIAQRHSLRAIPYTKISYTWNNKNGEFYIYGLQKTVYFKDYPERCFCACS
ncbi:protein SSUH2 homolog isoform X2 [Argiope bruennichi]|uniref:protein SSUH2 homolog isoform X2 n=1 Tax=Argiope bruennichi TaxID=94029 RepID=UPI0024954C6B|nr:protein SSUH2 homolog isoform X2 [Argiope bruennichi]